MGRGPEFEGAVIALVHFLLTRTDKTKALKARRGAGSGVAGGLPGQQSRPAGLSTTGGALVSPSPQITCPSPPCPPAPLTMQDAFYRQGLPNIIQLLATVAIFLMVVYFQVTPASCWPVKWCMEAPAAGHREARVLMSKQLLKAAATT